MEICKFLGVPHPRTANPDKMGYEEAINYVGYPCLIKPNLSAGAKGIKIIRNKADFDNYFQDITSHFGKSTIQEFIPQTGKQLKVQIYRGREWAGCSIKLLREMSLLSYRWWHQYL